MALYNNFDGDTLKTYLELEFSVNYDPKKGYTIFLGDTDVTKELDNDEGIMSAIESEWDSAVEDREDNDQFVDPYHDRGLSRSDF